MVFYILDKVLLFSGSTLLPAVPVRSPGSCGGKGTAGPGFVVQIALWVLQISVLKTSRDREVPCNRMAT